jgi:hypothetical protein
MTRLLLASLLALAGCRGATDASAAPAEAPPHTVPARDGGLPPVFPPDAHAAPDAMRPTPPPDAAKPKPDAAAPAPKPQPH